MSGEHLSPKTRELLDRPMEERVAHIQKDSWIPLVVIHSPALTLARTPTTVTSSRWPLTFTRNTANPVSSLWKVMRSINPENPSWGGDDAGVFTLQSVSMGQDPVTAGLS